jgi:uncharacterized protein involved in outer membrane biogenesis
MSATNAPPSTPRPKAGGRLLRVAVGLAIAIALFALFGFFVAPGLIKNQIETLLTERTHRKVTVERVRLNPFTLSASVQGFVMRERDGDAPFVIFDELFVDASAATIYRRAPVFDRVRLARPHVRVVRYADRRYNFQDLIDEALNAPPSDQPPPGFSLNNIEIVDGRIDFDDRPEGKRHEFTDIGIGIPFLSNLPYAVDIDVQPALAARVNGSPLELKGDTKPFKDTRETSLALNFDRIDLPRYAEYSPLPLPVRLTAGELDTQLTLRFATRAGNELQALTLAGGAELRGLALADRAGAPVASVHRLQAGLEVFDAVANVLKLKSVVIEQPVVHVTRQRDGSVNLLALLPPPSAAKTGEKPAKPLQYSVDRLAVVDGQVNLVDRQPVNRPFETDIRKVNVEVENLSSARGVRAKVRAGYETTTGAAFSYDGDLQVEPVGAAGRIEVKSFLLADLFPYYESLLDLQVDDGKLDLAANVALAGTGPPLDLRVSDIEAVLRSLKLTFPGQKTPQWRLATAEVRGGTVDLARQRIALGEVSVRDGVANIRREADGTFNFARVFKATAQTGKEAAPAADAAGWVVEAEQVRFGRFRAVYDDLALPRPFRLVAEPIEGTYRNYSNARGARGTLDVRATLNGKGRLAVSGAVATNPVAGDVRVDLRGFELAPLQPLIDDVVDVAITDGAVQAKGRLNFALGDRTTVGFGGDIDVTNFASIDKPTQASLLQWQSLHLGSVRATIEPLQVAVDAVALTDFYSRLILNADGTLNVQNLLARPGSATPAAAVRADGTAGAAPAPAGQTPPKEGFSFGAPEGRPSGEAPRSGRAAQTAEIPGGAPGRMPANVRVGSITLAGGNINFSDFFIKPNYSANLTGIAGSIGSLTPDAAGAVELRGTVDNTAPVHISGRINPLAPELFVDIAATARDIELPPLSPYSAKYAGYGIEKGKLSMDVKYLIENRKLTAENRVVLDQLTFGEKVESPTATKLPVLLAVALLKDRNGVIDVNLPVSGSIDDPKFSIGGIIVQIIVNLIVKAVTAPFALIGSLVGGAGEELAFVEFAPGSAKIDAPAEAKLGSIAKALADRPALKLDVAGRVDAEADREGLRKASLDRQVRAQKARALGKGQAAEDVSVDPAEYTKYLTAAYKAADFPKPRTFLGFLKDLPVAEMETLILTHASATDEDLRQLANQRAQAVKTWLVDTVKVPAERIFLTAPKMSAEGIKDKGRASRVDFALK